MSRLARLFQVRRFLPLNALFWSALAAVALAQHYARTVSPDHLFDWEDTIRHPVATYLTFWILSFLVFDIYLLTRRRHARQPLVFWMIHSLAALGFGILHKTLSYGVGLLLERLWLPHETKTWQELIPLWQQTFPDVLYGVLMYFVVLFVLLMLDHRQRFRDEHVRALELQNQLAQSQLLALKSQLQPHFLFNALNTIAMMVRGNRSNEAVTMIASLGQMLRSHLDRKQPWVTLQQELHLVDQYVSIEKARYQERLRVTQCIAPDVLSVRVPNLILQPLVENAFKHGIAHCLGVAHLRISARQEGRRLVLEVFNSGQPLPEDWNLQKHQGIGVGNTVNRLMRLYQGDFRFQMREQAGGLLVRVELPLEGYYASSSKQAVHGNTKPRNHL
ncbi:MAG: histidine kinase [Tunicatimonas sp.]